MTDDTPPKLTFREILLRVLRDRDALIMPTLFMSVALTALSTAVLAIKGRATDKAIFGDQPSTLFVLATVLPVAATTMVFIVRYLSGTLDRVHRLREPLSHDFELLRRETSRLKNTLVALNENDRASIVADIKRRLTDSATEEFLSDIRSKIREEEHHFAIAARSESSLKRIYQEIDALGRRGTLNLSIGVIMALVGLSLLGYIVLTGTPDATASVSSLATHFAPRFTVVIFVELFSFFFLRLYKSSLDEIKYFQNEATNLELRFAALDAALHEGDDALKTKVIESFLQTDRNPVMSAGMTTRELEALKQLDAKMRFTPEQIVDLLRATKESK